MIIEALKFKHPGIPIVVSAGKVTEWGGPGPAPTEKEVLAAVKEYQEHLASVAYRPSRAAEYPPIGDQLDAIWRFFDGMDLTGADKEFKDVYDAVKAVKDKYPKPVVK